MIYVGYSLSDENYLRLLRNISKMMNGNIRQSYFVSPHTDKTKLARAPISLIPVETDGAFFFEKMREALSERCGIIEERAFVHADLLLDEVAEKHNKTADAFIKTKHPLLIFALGYQDGLIHALQRITRMERTGEYHSIEALRSRVHGYDHRILELIKRKDFGMLLTLKNIRSASSSYYSNRRTKNRQSLHSSLHLSMANLGPCRLCSNFQPAIYRKQSLPRRNEF